jgi:hypothetical protein
MSLPPPPQPRRLDLASSKRPLESAAAGPNSRSLRRRRACRATPLAAPDATLALPREPRPLAPHSPPHAAAVFSSPSARRSPSPAPARFCGAHPRQRASGAAPAGGPCASPRSVPSRRWRHHPRPRRRPSRPPPHLPSRQLPRSRARDPPAPQANVRPRKPPSQRTRRARSARRALVGWSRASRRRCPAPRGGDRARIAAPSARRAAAPRHRAAAPRRHPRPPRRRRHPGQPSRR